MLTALVPRHTKQLTRNSGPSYEKVDSVSKNIEDKLSKELQRSGDVIIRDGSEINILLLDCDKGGALSMLARLRQNLQDYLAQQDLSDKIRVQFNTATYPDDAQNDEGLISKAKEYKK